jgi:steroid delta-isomerase-like uncharacterized protein
MSSENSALLRRWFEEFWNNGRTELIDEIVSANLVGQGQAEHSTQIGREQFRVFAQGIRAAFPDIRIIIHDVIEQGDRVAATWTATMTHQGQFLNLAPTGRKASVNGQTFAKVQNGKIVESWDNWDQLGLLVQLGSVQHTSFLPETVTEAKMAS